MDNKILFENKWFKIIDRTDENGANMVGIQPTGINVVVLPYTVDKDGFIQELGIVEEVNPLWGEGRHITAISGNVEEIDDDILLGAMRELLEESGIQADDSERWIYLGTIHNSKVVSQEQPVFAVDVTGLEIGIKSGDGTINEQLSEFKLMPVKQALFECKDVFIPTIFIRLFRDVLESSFTPNSDAPADPKSEVVEDPAID